MQGIRSLQIYGERALGSAIQIQAVFDEAPTSASIRIRDSWQVIRVNSAAMTMDSGGLLYTYIYQNTDINNFGKYLGIIKGVYNDNTIYHPFNFNLYDPDYNQVGGF